MICVNLLIWCNSSQESRGVASHSLLQDMLLSGGILFTEIRKTSVIMHSSVSALLTLSISVKTVSSSTYYFSFHVTIRPHRCLITKIDMSVHQIVNHYSALNTGQLPIIFSPVRLRLRISGFFCVQPLHIIFRSLNLQQTITVNIISWSQYSFCDFVAQSPDGYIFVRGFGLFYRRSRMQI